MPYRVQIDCNEREICFHALIFYRRIRPINRQPEVEINRRIRDREIRLIGENGEQLGIMSADAANRIADEKNLDLVKISPQSTPPVCKLMDYSKYKFEKSKKDKEDVAYYQRELQASENRRKQSESDDHLKELELKRKKRDAQIDAYSVSLKITDFLPELQKITQDDIHRMGEEAQHNLRTRIDMVRQTIDNIDAMFDGPRVIEGEITNEN